MPMASFAEKYGWNGILSALEINPSGLNDPRSWRKMRCVTTVAVRINGSRKCRVVNRVRVALLTDGPPQIQATIEFPT